MKNHFPANELKCPCCGELVFAPSFKFKLNKARALAGVPFIITSGYRCLEYNRSKKIGSSDTSSHPKGFAVDISVTSSSMRYKILHALIITGFSRIGIGNNFIHVDDDPGKPIGVVWVY